MKIVHIPRIANELHAVLDNNAVVRISEINGSPRIGCNVDVREGKWTVIGDNTDANCLNGICDFQPKQ